MNIRLLGGYCLAFAIGIGCRWFGVPLPAPPVLIGALIVVAMTCGYVLADKYIAAHPARHSDDCGGSVG